MRWPSSHAFGIALIIVSFLFWAVIPPVYWLPLSTTGKGVVVTLLIVLAEIAFWSGSFLAGKSLAERWRLIPRIKAWWNGRGTPHASNLEEPAAARSPEASTPREQP